MLHELCANATKYGAWSTDDGIIHLDWRTDEADANLLIEWRESGGPRIADASALERGSGTAIVDRLLASSGGSITREWKSEGLHARVTLPTRKKS